MKHHFHWALLILFQAFFLGNGTAAAQAPPRLDRHNLLIYRDAEGRIQPVKTMADWQKRRALILEGMQQVMGPLPGKDKRCPLDVKVEEETDCGAYVRRLVTYAADPGGRVPAYLLIPKQALKGKTQAPAVLCLHPTDNKIGHKVVVGLGGRPNRQYAEELAKRGYVTLAPSYPQLAQYQPDLDKLGYHSGTMKAIWDNIRGLDLLESLPFVKPGGMGVIGHSLGGHNSVYTAVFDERLKVVVSSCGLDSFLDYQGTTQPWEPGRGWTQKRYMPKLAAYKGRLEDIPFDFHELIGALAPRHCFINAPYKDGNFKWDSVDRIAKAAGPVYKLFGVPGRLRIEHPDCGHDFPNEMRQAAYWLFDQVLRGEATGPLRVHPANPRYFTDGSGQAIYLTGAHTWDSLVDMGTDDPPKPFDFDRYLDFLDRHGHNFIRLWTWDSFTWDTRANGKLSQGTVLHAAPLPWARTGPGRARDGKPRFDLTKFNPEYFERLRARVQAAGKRRVYVSVMLFEGWGLFHANKGRAAPAGWAWRSHPFHPDNNINDLDAAVDAITGAVHSLAKPKVKPIQAAYIRKVVDTVNDLDNVLFEVINEGGQKEWDWWVVKSIQDYERTQSKQHPMGITGHGAERVASMLASPATWISPGRADGYAENPPAWEGKKVSLLDTDHIWGVGGNTAWVWKSLMRGHNPLFMDPYDGIVLGKPHDPRWAPVRRALGQARMYADKVNLASMTPRDDLASTKYCLANPGHEYLVYLPKGGEVIVDLSAAAAPLAVEWFQPGTGASATADPVPGGGKRTLKAPYDTEAVLYLVLAPSTGGKTP